VAGMAVWMSGWSVSWLEDRRIPLVVMR